MRLTHTSESRGLTPARAARRSRIAVAIGLVVTIAALTSAQAGPVGPGPGARLEQRAKWLEGQLMAPCCRANPVADHYSGAADAMRREIRAMLHEGRDEAAILDVYVERHGEQILAMPRASGFGRVAYLAPLFVGIVGLLAVWLALARWRRPRDTDPTAPTEPAVDPADARRLEHEILRHG